MPDTLSTLDKSLKEVWTDDALVTQIIGPDKLLSRLERETKYHVGQQAVTPIETYLPGGYSAAPSAGSSALNAAGNTGINQAVWQYAYHYQQAKIEYAAIANTMGSDQAVVEAGDMSLENAVRSLRIQASRQAVTNGDALITPCGTTGGSTTVVLDATRGPQAIKRQWLHPGQVVDIGTSAAEDADVADTTITAVNPSTPSITIGTSITTDSSDYVSIANGRDGTTSYEMNGLKNIISTSTTLGGVAPASEWVWAAASVDTSTTALSLPALDTVAQQVYQLTDTMKTASLTSYKQFFRFREMLHVQARYTDEELKYGNEKLEYGGMVIEPHAHILDSEWYFVNFDDLFIVSPVDGPKFTDSITGGGRWEWGQSTTAFVGAVVWPFNVAAKKRVSMGGLTGLTAT